MSYADDVNRFLRERALLDWHPANRRDEAIGRVRVPGENTILAYARDLENFLNYLEATGVDWRQVQFQQLLKGYQAEQEDGSWSARGKSLAPATINRRVGTVCDFLAWAGDRGLRVPFQIIGSRTLTREHSGTRTKNVVAHSVVRAGRVRERLNRLRIPTVNEIAIWLREVETRRGPSMALACRTILETGVRLEELALLRAEQIPDPSQSIPGGPGRMEVVFGAKGYRRIGDPEMKGKPRVLHFTEKFLFALDDYRRLRRAKALVKFRQAHPNQSPPRNLFLSDETGLPITKRAIYDAWTSCRTQPFPAWSPHAGRHAFACLLLMRLIHEEATRIGQSPIARPRADLIGQAAELLRAYIRPILGHCSEVTSARYLDWIADHFFVEDHRSAWTRYLGEGDGQI